MQHFRKDLKKKKKITKKEANDIYSDYYNSHNQTQDIIQKVFFSCFKNKRKKCR